MGTPRARRIIAGLLIPVICSASPASARPSARIAQPIETFAVERYAIIEEGAGFVIRSRSVEPGRAAVPGTPLIPLGNGVWIDHRLVDGASPSSKETPDAAY